MSFVAQVRGVRAEKAKASLQCAFRDLASWEDRVLRAQDLRSLAMANAPRHTWASPEPHMTPGSIAPAIRSSAGAHAPAQSVSRVRLTPAEAAALAALQEEAAAAGACSLAPRGQLIYAPALGAAIARPLGVETLHNDGCSLRLAGGARATCTGRHNGRPAADGASAGARHALAATFPPSAAGHVAQQTAPQQRAPLGSKYLPAWKHVSARPRCPSDSLCATRGSERQRWKLMHSRKRVYPWRVR